MRFHFNYIFVLIILFFYQSVYSQKLNTYNLDKNEFVTPDGLFNEQCWNAADSISSLTMVEPSEGAESSFRTTVKVLAAENVIYVGIMCYDPEPEKIVSFSKSRDSDLSNEDNIKLVFDTFKDGRNGYIFSVNPYAARYDALVSDFGESENENWDANWTAACHTGSNGWSVEISIPLQNITFEKNTAEWGFNVQRKIQRLLETDRWTGIRQDYSIGQVIHAGTLINLPQFNLGIGLTSRFSGISRTSKTLGTKTRHKGDASVDLNQRITPNITAQLTFNTDFAETEVDLRQTNLSRFPLFFPEKRTFFIEGADIYEFGIGTETNVVPFFSRRIGLYDGTEVPVLFGGKLNGKISNTNFGMLFTRMDNLQNVVPNSTLGVLRVKQNILEESSAGIIATYGDPAGNKNVWLAGADFTYQTSKFGGDKNFLAGIWGIINNNENLHGDNSAAGLKIDYPNDLLDINLIYYRIGDAFSPSLGFVPRTGINSYHFGLDYMPRPDWMNIRQYFFMSGFTVITDLHNKWESYSHFIAPVHFLLESGDSFELGIAPEGENLKLPFEIEDGIVLIPGEYNWVRYGFELETAAKRPVNAELSWWTGSFYNGRLNNIEVGLTVRPLSYLIFEFGLEKNIVKLSQGNFNQDLFGSRIQLNLSSDFQLIALVQYDNDSRSLGTNTRLRWTFDVLGDLYIVYNHNINRISQRQWQYSSNEFVVKFSYGFWI